MLVTWNCIVTLPDIQSYYYYNLRTSESTVNGNYSYTPIVHQTVTGLKPETSYDLLITVTLCRKQNNVMQCGGGTASQSVATACGGIKN